jgi:glyoxylase-like metal-dependent hydrolase (beta-lactamase superfamily II)
MFCVAIVRRVVATATMTFACGMIPRSSPRLVHAAPAQRATLQLKEYSADSTGFDVNSTLIYGPTEAILVDAQYRVSDAGRVADMIAATGRHLKAIFITHPDDDHYFGVATIVARFPGTPVYMSPVALDEFRTREVAMFAGLKERLRNPPPGRTPPPEMLREIPDSLIMPQVPLSSHLTIDGVDVQIVADRQGDVLKPANSYLWIPSQRTVIAGDIVFNGVHVWLAASSEASRAEWRRTIQQIADLHPLVVVAGHKSDVNAPDGPDVLAATATYLTDFDAAKRASAIPEDVVATMRTKYPQRAVSAILWAAARQAK